MNKGKRIRKKVRKEVFKIEAEKSAREELARKIAEKEQMKRFYEKESEVTISNKPSRNAISVLRGKRIKVKVGNKIKEIDIIPIPPKYIFERKLIEAELKKRKPKAIVVEKEIGDKSYDVDFYKKLENRGIKVENITVPKAAITAVVEEVASKRGAKDVSSEKLIIRGLTKELVKELVAVENYLTLMESEGRVRSKKDAARKMAEMLKEMAGKKGKRPFIEKLEELAKKRKMPFEDLVYQMTMNLRERKRRIMESFDGSMKVMDISSEEKLMPIHTKAGMVYIEQFLLSELENRIIEGPERQLALMSPSMMTDKKGKKTVTAPVHQLEKYLKKKGVKVLSVENIFANIKQKVPDYIM
ncbi:hypothetical protein DRN74_02810 [Candidatus Micrarchaeota archaeon]|nr:MAG: hypothetical protein DRN74_02810 [Candidatus Micrarchaeota archaeon]